MEENKFQELVLNQLEILTTGQTKMQGDISSLQNDVSDLRSTVVRMENDLNRKINALFDAREVQQEVNERIIASIERLEQKVDKLEIETAHLKRAK